jgi:hypothetical protein
MLRVSMATRDELIAALSGRYGEAGRIERGRILDEFVAVTGYHRKHAMRVLRSGPSNTRHGSRPGRRIYGEAVRQALILLWEASDRVCGKRLKALLPVLIPAMERHGRLALDPAVRAGVLAMSAATIDRALARCREVSGVRRRWRSAGLPAVRREIPIRTFTDWCDPAPGFVEADLVAHSGPSTRGSYVQTLVLTDIASGWTECAPLLVREQHLLGKVLKKLTAVMPFLLLGLDTDNDTVFINETLKAHCAADGIVFTRCRPYRKNDQAHVEQKNGAVVRRLVGYRRLEGLAAARELARLYAAARLFVNFFQPSFKLIEKSRDGAVVRKRYAAPATPCQRLLADARTPEDVRAKLKTVQSRLDPVALLHEIRHRQRRLVAIADKARSEEAEPESLDKFLAALKTAWAHGTPRPTEQRPLAKVRWWRSRKDPFETTWPEIKQWAEAEPELSGRQLLQRLQAQYPGAHPEGQLRTLQRRLKAWRAEMARALVLGSWSDGDRMVEPSSAEALPRPDAEEGAIVLAAVKDEPFGWPPERPSLTAAARDGV